MSKKFLSLLVLGAWMLAVTGLMGCSSTDSSQSSGRMPAAREALAPAPKRAAPSSSVRQAQAQSSLDALRRGESGQTPSSSPLQEIYFDFDRYELSSAARATLKTAGDWLRSNPSVRVEIEGHCDERGTSEYNLALGAKRAQAAKDYLVSLGVAAGRLLTISYGEEIPLCREANESCWSRNRRARFVVLTAKPGV